MEALNSALALAQSLSITPNEAERHGLALNKDGQRRSAFELLAYPNIALDNVAKIWPQLSQISVPIAQQLEIEAKYDVYMQRQAQDVESYRRDESFELPSEFDYTTLPGLSNEARQKLTSIRPRTIGQAGRIDGMTPAALTLLVAHARRRKRAAKR
jgi:tRNA uridine 5-carboxymethylaminomethyl modification enzyme